MGRPRMLHSLHLHTRHTISQRQEAVKLLVTDHIRSAAEGTRASGHPRLWYSAQVVQFALAEDAGELGDVTTLSTYANRTVLHLLQGPVSKAISLSQKACTG